MNKLNVEYDLVVIIDCLSESERTEHELSSGLAQFLATNGIKQVCCKCNNKAQFLEAINYVKNIAFEGKRFCIHFVSHGLNYGLWLREKNECVYWSEFAEPLSEINEKQNNTLIINMTSCKGLNAVKIVDDSESNYPFFGLIGCNRDLYTDEAKIANEKFYSSLLAGEDISIATSKIQNHFLSEKNESVIFCISSQGYIKLNQ